MIPLPAWLRRSTSAAPETRAVSVSSSDFMQMIGLGGYGRSSAGVTVTVEAALGVPAVFAAVNFLAGTIAGLPLHVYRRRGGEKVRVSGSVADLLNEAANDECTSFDWRKYKLERVLTGGRGLTYIERNAAGNPVNLFSLDPGRTTVRRETDTSGRVRVFYEHRDGRSIRYPAGDVIDLTFMRKPDGISVYSPILSNRNTIGAAIAAEAYASGIFENGGIPPLVLQGNFATGQGAVRAADDISRVIEEANNDGRKVWSVPTGHELKALGFNAEQMQLLELRKFLVIEIARIYSLPVTFLQDLTHGTFSNTEQEDLRFVKHTIKRWVEALEQELTLKLFGRGATRFVEFNLDGLLRGDFKTRMEGFARAIQTAQLRPNEARALDNRPPVEGGDQLLVQGATIPLALAGGSPQLEETDDDET